MKEVILKPRNHFFVDEESVKFINGYAIINAIDSNRIVSSGLINKNFVEVFNDGLFSFGNNIEKMMTREGYIITRKPKKENGNIIYEDYKIWAVNNDRIKPLQNPLEAIYSIYDTNDNNNNYVVISEDCLIEKRVNKIDNTSQYYLKVLGQNNMWYLSSNPIVSLWNTNCPKK